VFTSCAAAAISNTHNEHTAHAIASLCLLLCRRRILRHMYNSPMRSCWLFSGCQQKFLDALLATAKVELYMPKVSTQPELLELRGS
jgi:hypothetical protein